MKGPENVPCSLSKRGTLTVGNIGNSRSMCFQIRPTTCLIQTDRKRTWYGYQRVLRWAPSPNSEQFNRTEEQSVYSIELQISPSPYESQCHKSPPIGPQRSIRGVHPTNSPSPPLLHIQSQTYTYVLIKFLSVPVRVTGHGQ